MFDIRPLLEFLENHAGFKGCWVGRGFGYWVLDVGIGYQVLSCWVLGHCWGFLRIPATSRLLGYWALRVGYWGAACWGFLVYDADLEVSWVSRSIEY